MYRKVLVPLDGSTFSETALEEVRHMTVDAPTRVVLITAPELPANLAEEVPGTFRVLPQSVIGAASRAEREHDETLDERERRALAYLDDAGGPLRGAGIEVETVVRFGDPSDVIVSYAQTHDVDVIVMATHGRTGLAGVLLGSVASEVLKDGRTPVLMVRPEALRRSV